MKKVLKIVSFLGLAVLLISPILEMMGRITTSSNKWGIAIGTVLWFTTAPFWMKAKEQ